MSAKKKGHFAVFHGHTNGFVKSILQSQDYDFLYPQKVGNILFYIERKTKEGEYKKEHISYNISCVSYPLQLINELQNLQNLQNLIDPIELHDYDFDQKSEKIEIFRQKKINLQKKEIIDFKTNPIAFLHMISEDEGFFLEHPQDIDRHDEIITFHCHLFRKTCDTNWRNTEIFSFSIPSFLILDIFDFCLYESILPLLPRCYNGKIYYVDCSSSAHKNLNLFSYDLYTGVIEQKSFAEKHQLFFSPVFTQKRIFFGGKIKKYDTFPNMWINDEGSVCIDLPYSIY